MTSAATAFTPREQLIGLLCEDLNAQGWNQPAKLWWVMGTPGDEWLQYVRTFTGPPENHIVSVIIKKEFPDDAIGVVVATEGWAYPKRVTDSFANASELRAYWRFKPPSEHPEGVEIRHLLLASKDGDVIALTHYRDPQGTREWTSIDKAVESPVGDNLVDALRALLGLHAPLLKRIEDLALPALNKKLTQLLTVLGQVVSGKKTMTDAAVELFESLPEDERQAMLDAIPGLREELQQRLPDDKRKRYGLD